MKKISSAYWEKFINIDSDGNEKGNGIEFENLVNCLLVSMYRKNGWLLAAVTIIIGIFGFILKTNIYGQNVKTIQTRLQ